MVTAIDGVFYKKNTERKENGVLTGECDIFHTFKTFDSLPDWYKERLKEKGITTLEKPLKVIQDIKSCWDAETFMNSHIEKGYEWQGRTYMELWDADEFWLRYTLNDCPEHILKYEQYKFIMNNNIDEDSKEGIEQIEDFKRSLVYTNNPAYTKEERQKCFIITRDDAKIEQLYDVIKHAIEHYKTISLNN